MVLIMLLLPQAMRICPLTDVPSRRQRTYTARFKQEVKRVIADILQIEFEEGPVAAAEHSTRRQMVVPRRPSG